MKDTSCPGRSGIIYDERYLEHDTGNHPESATRIERVVAVLKEKARGWNLDWMEPRAATPEELMLIHSQTHVESVRRFCDGGGGYIWVDTACSAESFEVARLAVGGLMVAADAVMEGRLSNAFALVRPPGHHATRDQAQGFCLFNNIAVAARYLQQEYGIQRILIVDWDCHHGNGTESAFLDEASVLYFSVHEEWTYPGTGAAAETGCSAGKGYNVNVPLPSGCGDEVYERAFRELLVPIAREYCPEFILVSSGQDAHFADPFSTMQLTAAGFGRLAAITRELAHSCCGGRLVLTLEGGYNRDAQADSILAIVAALTGRETETPDATGAPKSAPPELGRIHLEAARDIQRAHWKGL
ncbi:MAG: histone deacetylase [Bacillota bacterium]